MDLVMVNRLEEKEKRRDRLSVPEIPCRTREKKIERRASNKHEGSRRKGRTTNTQGTEGKEGQDENLYLRRNRCLAFSVQCIRTTSGN